MNLTVATGIVAAIGDVSRFNSPQKLVSYFGLNPRVRQSGRGYGIRDADGTIEFKDESGSWSSIQNTLYTLCGGDCGGGGGTPVAFSVNKGGTT